MRRPGAARRRGRPRRTPPGPAARGWFDIALTIARQIARSAPGSARRTPPTTDAKTSLVAVGTPRPPLEHREQQGEAPGIETLGAAPRRPAAGGGGWSAPAPRRAAVGALRASAGPPIRARPVRRSVRNSRLASGTPTQARLDHLEQAELLGRTEPVLDRAQHPQRVVAVALERRARRRRGARACADRRGRRPW